VPAPAASRNQTIAQKQPSKTLDISAVRNLNTYTTKIVTAPVQNASSRPEEVSAARVVSSSFRNEQKIHTEESVKREQTEPRPVQRQQAASEEDLFKQSGAPLDQYDAPALLRRRRKS
ncbi:MAG: hypothetical protein RR214_02960, partial [Synergistaceae bacterium]